jgi:hypothetical protein
MRFELNVAEYIGDDGKTVTEYGVQVSQRPCAPGSMCSAIAWPAAVLSAAACVSAP